MRKLLSLLVLSACTTAPTITSPRCDITLQAPQPGRRSSRRCGLHGRDPDDVDLGHRGVRRRPACHRARRRPRQLRSMRFVPNRCRLHRLRRLRCLRPGVRPGLQRKRDLRRSQGACSRRDPGLGLQSARDGRSHHPGHPGCTGHGLDTGLHDGGASDSGTQRRRYEATAVPATRPLRRADAGTTRHWKPRSWRVAWSEVSQERVRPRRARCFSPRCARAGSCPA